MKVVLEGVASQEVPVGSGVPQGTVLGPLLFMCHINDLPDSVASQVRLFADDCLLYRQINSPDDHITLQQDLENLETWAQQWGMRFNANKCSMLSIRNKSTHFYSLNNTILKHVSDIRYLGIHFSSDLKWNLHVSNTTKRANSTLGFLRRNLRNCPPSCRRTAYMALVRSALEYGAVVWDPYSITNIDRLERIQHRAARFITGDYNSRKTGCITEMLRSLKLQPLQVRRKQLRLILLYKIANGLVTAIPSHLYLTPKKKGRLIRPRKLDGSTSSSSNPIANSIAVNSKCFKASWCNTDQLKNSFFNRTIIDWNHLNENLVQADSVERFRTLLSHGSHSV